MKLTGDNWSTRGKTCPSATLPTTNPTWTDPGSNPGLRGGRPATNRLSYGTALTRGVAGRWRVVLSCGPGAVIFSVCRGWRMRQISGNGRREAWGRRCLFTRLRRASYPRRRNIYQNRCENPVSSQLSFMLIPYRIARLLMPYWRGGMESKGTRKRMSCSSFIFIW
jgi:hypothetical protein